MLCFIDDFDLINDPLFCPPERNALKEFYVSAKGSEWTVSTNWMDPQIGHCRWYGVTCNDENVTIGLELQGNGLSGTLTPFVSNLSALEVLDLNNNDIKVVYTYHPVYLLSLLKWVLIQFLLHRTYSS